VTETVGGTAAETVGEAVGTDKAAAAIVRMCSARPRRHCSDRETDGRAPRGFDFFPNLPKTGSIFKIQNGYLIFLQKFLIFACGLVGILLTIFSIIPTSNS
jgi:hypothetical protein